MTLSTDLLPAMQHYALFAAALTLFSLSLTHVKRRFGLWVWFLVLALPVFQIGWSLWETIEEVEAAGSHAASWIIFRAVLHGLAITFVSGVVLVVASRPGDDFPKRVKFKLTISGPRKYFKLNFGGTRK